METAPVPLTLDEQIAAILQEEKRQTAHLKQCATAAGWIIFMAVLSLIAAILWFVLQVMSAL